MLLITLQEGNTLLEKRSQIFSWTELERQLISAMVFRDLSFSIHLVVALGQDLLLCYLKDLLLITRKRLRLSLLYIHQNSYQAPLWNLTILFIAHILCSKILKWLLWLTTKRCMICVLETWIQKSLNLQTLTGLLLKPFHQSLPV